VFVLNDCRPSSTLPELAAEALADYGHALSPVRLGSRVGFVKSLSEGKGTGRECTN
jgi:chromosome partitioning protein